MLIRSQDKRMIVNFENICTVSAFPEKDSEDIYVEDGTGSLMVGRYSTKAKAMKVLDMIQEAYEEYKITRTFLTGFTGHRAIVESNDIHVNGFKELVKSFKKNMVFQMPEDSEAEV
jgi:hypothetical protein|nr:MAG TPA: hypothetical protein [Caudoviricetes sp.]